MSRLSLPRWRPLLWRCSPWLCAAVSCGCEGERAASSLPEPPALDRTLVSGSADGSGSVTLVGEGRSASTGASVRVTNLENDDDPELTSAEADGSFALEIAADPGDELRVEALRGGERSDAIDLIAGDTLEPSPRHDCVRLIPEFAVEFSRTRQNLVIENTCDAGIVIENPRTRLGLPDFELTTELPIPIEAGRSAALTLEFSGESSRETEDVLLFDVSLDGDVLRYPATLFAPVER